ncbi:hypothetical protein BD309DRAFT_1078469 [Dichomitus squalens]|uniref:Uncharacterized protein n=1 Tax=Dichomitus squalens TaxID=114155 RepID=A0A4Q9PPS6_9APHY|nr:hypothetical protein BD311DRAFT_866589 [Dichomitus squalens]TBU46637.1 hypothetical protein BD309DRAFT_1078469 [Dichomitus squalens]TBU56340.1 hypothetical protein BD310DRAFT_931691 [Dichomitus squalens]
MVSPSGKVDPELGIELDRLLEDSSLEESEPGTHQAAGNVITRTWRRLLLRFAICTSLTLVALYLILSRPRESHPSGPRCYLGSVPKDVPPYEPGECFDHINWTAIDLPDSETTGLLHAHAFVDLPLNATKELSFLNLGNMTHGAFRISQNGASDANVAIGIQAYYRDPEQFSKARICRLHPAEDKWGLGIYTPDVPDSDDSYNLKLTVNVVLPGTDDNGDLLPLQYVRTYLPHYNHWLGGLVDAIYIDPESIPKYSSTSSIPSVLPSSSTSFSSPASTTSARPKHLTHPPYRCVFPDNA